MAATLSTVFRADNAALSATAAEMRIDKIVVPAADVKLLHTTPITLVPSQGTGTIINVHRITFASTFNANAYTGTHNLEFRYTNASGDKVTDDISNTVLNFASGTKYNFVTGVTQLAQVAATPIIVCVPVADPGAGDSIVNFYVEYTVLVAP